TSLTDKTIEMPTAQIGKNNILETQGHGKVYCFKAEDTFRKGIMLKADLMNSHKNDKGSGHSGNKATDQHKSPQYEPLCWDMEPLDEPLCWGMEPLRSQEQQNDQLP
ncbi:hypothetical protein STEG23_004055, partial [Scotinomys teguina]